MSACKTAYDRSPAGSTGRIHRRSVTDRKRPLPAAVSEFMIEHPTATPTEVLGAVDLDEEFPEQVEFYCAVTRYFRYGGNDGCETPDGVKPTTVEWSDVVDWDVSSETD